MSLPSPTWGGSREPGTTEQCVIHWNRRAHHSEWEEKMKFLLSLVQGGCQKVPFLIFL